MMNEKNNSYIQGFNQIIREMTRTDTIERYDKY